MSNNTIAEKSIKNSVEYTVIGNNLKVLMKRAGLSYTELGDKIGKTRSYVSHIVNGRFVPDVLIMKKICSALNCDVFDLLEWKKVEIREGGENEC